LSFSSVLEIFTVELSSWASKYCTAAHLRSAIVGMLQERQAVSDVVINQNHLTQETHAVSGDDVINPLNTDHLTLAF